MSYYRDITPPSNPLERSGRGLEGGGKKRLIPLSHNSYLFKVDPPKMPV